MSKQDRQGVRTATDLERKYNLAGVQKATRMNEQSINKTNASLEKFVNTTTEHFVEMQKEIEKSMAYDVDIVSSNGNIFKNGDIESTLTAIVWKSNEDVTSQFTDSQFSWTRVSKDPDGDIEWNNAHKFTKTVEITKEDVNIKAIFNVILTLPELEGIATGQITIVDCNDGIGIASVDVEYYNSTSASTLTGGSWSTDAPTWEDEKYIWSKTVTKYTDNSTKESTAVCITGGKGSSGSEGNGVSSIIEEYYLSTSKTTQTGSSWSTTAPTWSSGKYVWSRSKITYTDGTIAYTTPICDSSWEAVNEIQIGGRNLAKKSNIQYYSITPTVKDYSYTWSANTITAGLRFPYTIFTIGQYYVLSFKVTVNSGSINSIGGHSLGYSILGIKIDGVQVTQNATSWLMKHDVNWTEGTHTVEVYFSYKAGSTDNNIYIQPNRGGTAVSYDITVFDIQIENGNKKTDWTPAPEDVESKIDTKSEIWFYAGKPTLSNAPVSSWDIEEYEIHVGDMYYDTATGYCYRFKLASGVYSWEQIQDNDTKKALALANSASDTADSKRRVFFETPYTPYDSGDLWFKDQEIYRCQISKAETETYAEDDFIIATKYTDDTVANQVGDKLEVVRGSVLTIQENADAFKIDIETTVKSIDELQQETVESLERMSYTFATDDLSIAKSTDPVNTRINNQGLRVFTYEELNSIFNHNGAGINKLIVTGDSQLANISIVKATDESGNACTDINHLISNIQTLSDLEGE